MADFCKACSIELFTDDSRELAGITGAAAWKKGLAAIVTCEGCGCIQVDPDGVCISPDCLKAGQPGHGPADSASKHTQDLIADYTDMLMGDLRPFIGKGWSHDTVAKMKGVIAPRLIIALSHVAPSGLNVPDLVTEVIEEAFSEMEFTLAVPHIIERFAELLIQYTSEPTKG